MKNARRRAALPRAGGDLTRGLDIAPCSGIANDRVDRMQRQGGSSTSRQKACDEVAVMWCVEGWGGMRSRRVCVAAMASACCSKREVVESLAAAPTAAAPALATDYALGPVM